MEVESKMNKTLLTIIFLIAIFIISFRAVNAQQVPPHVCNNLPSQNHNPHCQDDEAEPEQPVEPEQPTEPEQAVEDEIIDRDTTVITNCVHGDSMTKDVCDKFDTIEVENNQQLITEGK
jgi:heme-binding NEAT domain protein